MNSFKSIQRAIEHEKERQINELEHGRTIIQETRRWDDIEGQTFEMRDKEDAQDYRYFPEPDLVAIRLSDELFENPRSPKDIIKEKGWIQISDENAIKDVVLQVLSANPQSIADFKAGKDRALGFLVGQAI